VCRCAVYQYEHIDPEYSEAKEHNPENICLLCGGCHDKVTRGRLSKETIKKRYKHVQESDAIRKPFEELDLSSHNISVILGTASFELAKQLIRINGKDLLSILPPSDESSFPKLSGIFCDTDGNETLRITENIWEGSVDAWDIQVVGKEIIVKASDGRKALVLKIEPPDCIVVRELNMFFENCHLVCTDKGLMVGRVQDGKATYIGIGNFQCAGASVGVDIDSSIGSPTVTGVRMVGGQGIVLEGSGIRIAVGAGVMLVADLRVWNQ